MNVLEKMKQSGNELLKHEAEDIEKWKAVLSHNTKKDLEIFLSFNIVDFVYLSSKTNKQEHITCTSNTWYIDSFKISKEPELLKYFEKVSYDGIHTKDSFSIMTFDLVENKYKTIPIRKLQSIAEFIGIHTDNVKFLYAATCGMLNKKCILSQTSLSKAKK